MDRDNRGDTIMTEVDTSRDCYPQNFRNAISDVNCQSHSVAHTLCALKIREE